MNRSSQEVFNVQVEMMDGQTVRTPAVQGGGKPCWEWCGGMVWSFGSFGDAPDGNPQPFGPKEKGLS